jgi:autotransporter-associated beta strand protein
MRFQRVCAWAIAGLVVCPLPLAADPPPKITTMPQLIQDGFGPGGIELPDNGLEYCGPTSMTMNFAWLGLAGHTRLGDPNGNLNLDETIGALMQTGPFSGTTDGTTGYSPGLELYLAMKGYQGQYTYVTGGLYGPNDDNNPGQPGQTTPTWSDLQTAVTDTPTALNVGTFLVGWYETSGAVRQREGGHWVTLVDASTPGQLIINNPYPFPGFNEQQTITLDTLGNFPAEQDGVNYNLSGFLNAANGMNSNTSTPFPGYAYPIIEQYFMLSLATTPPAASTWQLDPGANAISVGAATQEVLAPIADSSSGPSRFLKEGSGAILFTEAASYTGGTVVEEGFLGSTVSTGTPFGTGTIELEGGTLSIAPAGNSADVQLSAGTGGQPFSVNGANNLVLDAGENNSVTFTVGSGGNGTSGGNGVFQMSNTSISALMISAPQSGLAGLGVSEKFIINGTGSNQPQVMDGMVSPAIVGQDHDADLSGGFLTYDAANGFMAVTPVTGDINTQPTSAIYSADGIHALTDDRALQALLVNDVSAIQGAFTLQVGNNDPRGAGVILNGGSIHVQTLDFGSSQGLVYVSGAGGTISSAITSTNTNGLNVFGPGNLLLSGASSFSGNTIVHGGATVVLRSVSGGGANLAGNVIVGNRGTLTGDGRLGGNLTVNNGGTRLGGGRILGNLVVAEAGTFSGTGEVGSSSANTATIEGTLGDFVDEAGNSGLLTFKGDMTLESTGFYYWTMRSLSDETSPAPPGLANDRFHVEGTLTFEAGSQFGIQFDGVNAPGSGDSFWDSDRSWLVASSDNAIVYGSGGYSVIINSLSYANGYFQYDPDEAANRLVLQWVATPVPEPSSGIFLLGAGGALALWRRKALMSGG